MIRATLNQLHNIKNKYQGDTKKVLTVCSAGLLRSATLQNYLIKEYGYNVRNCGTEASYALIPISDALVLWADEIVFVNQENFNAILPDLKSLEVLNKCKILDIPDIYPFNAPELIEICAEQYKNANFITQDE
jgi:predicted protein tyrosine phosphatase